MVTAKMSPRVDVIHKFVLFHLFYSALVSTNKTPLESLTQEILCLLKAPIAFQSGLETA